jgi:hypothetical protein
LRKLKKAGKNMRIIIEKDFREDISSLIRILRCRDEKELDLFVTVEPRHVKEHCTLGAEDAHSRKEIAGDSEITSLTHCASGIEVIDP